MYGRQVPIATPTPMPLLIQYNNIIKVYKRPINWCQDDSAQFIGTHSVESPCHIILLATSLSRETSLYVTSAEGVSGQWRKVYEREWKRSRVVV